MINKSILYKEESSDKLILILLFISTIAILFFCTTISPLYPISEWSDINLYFNIGKGIFNGKVLYTDVFDHKGPLIFFIYGFGYLLSNDSYIGMFFILSIGWLAMVYYAYFTARLFLDSVYAFIVTLIFSVMILSHTMDGGSADEIITIFMVVSLYYFISYFNTEGEKHKYKHMLIHGLMCGLTAFIKINLLVFWMFPLLVILIDMFKQKDYRNLMANIGMYLLGILIVALPIVLYLYINDALLEAYNTYIVLNSEYARVGSVGEVLGYLAIRIYQRFRFDRIEFLVIIIGAFYYPFKYITHKMGRVGIMLSFLSLYTMIYMSPTYFYYYSVPTYIFVILGGIAIIKFLSNFISIKYVWHVCILFAVLSVYFAGNWKGYFGYAADQLIRGEKIISVENQFGAIIEQEDNPTLLNLSHDLGNTVFTQSNIMPSVKYFISPNLYHDFYPVMRDEQTRYIENKEVQFIMLSTFSINYDYYNDLQALKDNYTIVSQYVDRSEGYKTYYLFKRND